MLPLFLAQLVKFHLRFEKQRALAQAVLQLVFIICPRVVSSVSTDVNWAWWFLDGAKLPVQSHGYVFMEEQVQEATLKSDGHHKWAQKFL